MLCSLLDLYLLALSINNVLSVDVLNFQWKAIEGRAENSTVRKTRGVDTPPPIDCRLRQWSPWTPCTACKETKSRFKYLEQAAQFGGTECISSQWDTRACAAEPACDRKHDCAGGFTCKETGRCVSERLRCNGERDCRDWSDEDECDEESFPEGMCSQLFPIPGSEIAVRGYNILTGEFLQNTIDPTYYGGVCEYVYNGEWRKLVYDAFCENLYYNDDEKYYRKPYNFHTYRFMGHADTGGSSEYYEDAASLLKARKDENSFNLGFTFGINTVEVGLSGSSESMILSNISKYDAKNLGFVRLVSKVQTAQFKMRSRGLMLDEDMYQSLVELPEEYHFGAYSRFLTQYGMHYITSGIMGGRLEYILVVDKTEMRKHELSGSEAGTCLGASIGFAMSDHSTLKLKGSTCAKHGTFSRGVGLSSSFIKDVISNVQGGSTGSSGGLLAVRDAKTYQSWGKSLKYNPGLIEFESLPVYELVRFSAVAEEMKGKVALLKRAYEEYLQEFSSCRCAPCKNNGVAVLLGTSCHCLCKQGYQGVACEETERKGPTHGSWSCWGPWSASQSQRKTRERQCNNPAPLNEGMSCLGQATQTYNI
ncbi:hypothetical protein MATL_G00197580 [Megalops atlanticus]|uniref:MACPF domain-containing protein n=1 Tax=Megalops atlanticus TaxID=7932 RepID=A0A9D3PJW7_MEGAT|nr:hypothetical protein MATL_G00197580 [Megalops atlanticus]